MNRIIGKSKYYFKSINSHAGMTLIELLVVLSIFMMVTGVTMFDYGTFRSSLSTQNLANDIALAVRKAQSYAIGSHGLSSVFINGYGIHFTTSTNIANPLSGSYKSFIMFVDSNADKLYNIPSSGTCAVGNECNEILSITSTDIISDVYINDNDQGTPNPIATTGSMDISFLRPNPDAIFCYRIVSSGSSCDQDNTTITHVKIKVSNNQSGVNLRTKMITIWNTGQISIK